MLKTKFQSAESLHKNKWKQLRTYYHFPCHLLHPDEEGEKIFSLVQ